MRVPRPGPTAVGLFAGVAFFVVLALKAALAAIPTLAGEPEAGAAPHLPIKVNFVTNRVVESGTEGRLRFSNVRGVLTGGHCQVELDPAYSRPRFLSASSEAFDDTLRRFQTYADRGVVLYIHGYYEDFERACRRAAIFQERLAIDAGFLLLTWPANSTPFTYAGDVVDMDASVPDLKRVLSALGNLIGPNNVSVVAHSLGTRGLIAALEGTPVVEFPKEQRLRDLILVAADVDRRRFLSVVPILRGQVEELTVLVSDRDLPLRASSWVNGAPRLGQATDLESNDVDVINVSEVEATHLSGHIYHLRNDDVVAMIRRVLLRRREDS